MPIPFIYPTTGWSTGFMRKRGQRSDNGDDEEATVQQVMDIQRRGQPELSGGPGVAEAEALAGSGIGARGGATRADTQRLLGRLTGETGEAVSPAVIERNKAQLKTMIADRLLGPMDLRKVNKWAKDRGFESIVDLDPIGELTLARETLGAVGPPAMGKAADIMERMGRDPEKVKEWREASEYMQRRMAEAPQNFNYFQKFLWAAVHRAKEQGQDKGIPMIDPNGKLHDIPIVGKRLEWMQKMFQKYGGDDENR